MRQWYCYTCLAIGGYFGRVTKLLGNQFLREYMRGLYSHSREYRKIFLRDNFPHVSQIPEGIHSVQIYSRACIRSHANTGKYSWRIIHVLVSCQAVIRAGAVYPCPTCLLTGRPGCRRQRMEMNGGSSASYLARTPCAPCFVLCLTGGETEGLLDYHVRWNLRPVIFGVGCLGPLLRAENVP